MVTPLNDNLETNYYLLLHNLFLVTYEVRVTYHYRASLSLLTTGLDSVDSSLAFYYTVSQIFSNCTQHLSGFIKWIYLFGAYMYFNADWAAETAVSCWHHQVPSDCPQCSRTSSTVCACCCWDVIQLCWLLSTFDLWQELVLNMCMVNLLCYANENSA